MPLFYYPSGADIRQIEADSYRRVQSAPVGSEYGWQQTLTWNSGLTESYFTGDYDETAAFTLPGSRCGNFDQGISYKRNNVNFCAENGRPPRQRLSSISFAFIPANGVCNIEFIKDETVILTLPTCPDIGEDSRNPNCSDCCRELLTIAREIRV